MRRNILNVLLVIIAANVCSAQSDTTSLGLISGTVTDHKTGERMPFANVCIAQLDRCTTTGEDGYYAFKDIPVGRYTITTLWVGYEPYSRERVKVCANEITKHDISLRSNAPGFGPAPVKVKTSHRK